jgi:hypothetical protein
MRHFLITAAAMTAFAASLASVPARADMNYGPTQVGNKCFKWNGTNARDATFGYWAECPKPASVAVTPTTSRRVRHSSK